MHNKILFSSPIALQFQDWNISNGTTLRFNGSEGNFSQSFLPIFIEVLNDNISEPIESLICVLLATSAAEVRAVEPNQVTITISDDDG